MYQFRESAVYDLMGHIVFSVITCERMLYSLEGINQVDVALTLQDAVGHSMVDDIKEYAESLYTDEEFQLRRANYSAHCMPFTKESLFYREIFEKYYHDQSRTIVGFWMPNKAWPNCNVNDPSARVLANYGASGV